MESLIAQIYNTLDIWYWGIGYALIFRCRGQVLQQDFYKAQDTLQAQIGKKLFLNGKTNEHKQHDQGYLYNNNLILGTRRPILWPVLS